MYLLERDDIILPACICMRVRSSESILSHCFLIEEGGTWFQGKVTVCHALLEFRKQSDIDVFWLSDLMTLAWAGVKSCNLQVPFWEYRRNWSDVIDALLEYEVHYNLYVLLQHWRGQLGGCAGVVWILLVYRWVLIMLLGLMTSCISSRTSLLFFCR